jgi:hypothetical protein
METPKDIFDVFLHDENYKYIMKRLLEASMEVYRKSLNCDNYPTITLDRNEI